MADASTLILSAHGSALRALSGTAHFEGLGQAARAARKSGALTPKLIKRLANLDAAASLVRHVTPASVEKLLADIAAELSADAPPH